MVRQHVLIGLGFKKQNFRNRALRYMMDKTTKGRGVMTMRPAVMPPSYSRPQIGNVQRQALKFNY
jgi:hypothetical protein